MIPFTSRPLQPHVLQAIEQLKPGQRIRITHSVRVGSKTWPAVVTGVFRSVNSLATGITTSRDPHDDIIVPLVHFVKDNQELSSVALDENCKIELID